MIVVEQLSIWDVLDVGLSRDRERDWSHRGPAFRLLRAKARSIVGDCRAIGVDPAPVLGPLRHVIDQAVYCDSRFNVRHAGEDVVVAWERAARDRLRAARLLLEDDLERGRCHQGRHSRRVQHAGHDGRAAA